MENNIELYNIARAELAGKKVFKVSRKSPEGRIERYVFASSFEQCISKYKNWRVRESNINEYLIWAYQETKKRFEGKL